VPLAAMASLQRRRVGGMEVALHRRSWKGFVSNPGGAIALRLKVIPALSRHRCLKLKRRLLKSGSRDTSSFWPVLQMQLDEF